MKTIDIIVIFSMVVLAVKCAQTEPSSSPQPTEQPQRVMIECDEWELFKLALIQQSSAGKADSLNIKMGTYGLFQLSQRHLDEYKKFTGEVLTFSHLESIHTQHEVFNRLQWMNNPHKILDRALHYHSGYPMYSHRLKEYEKRVMYWFDKMKNNPKTIKLTL